MSNKTLTIGVVLAIVIAVLAFVRVPVQKALFGSASACTDGYTCFTNLEVQGNQIVDGTMSLLSSFTLGTNGTALTELKSGTCTIWSNATTIAASSTATVECTGATNGSLSGITGIQSGDRVFTNLASTTVAGFEGLSVQWSAASTTANGGIMMKIYNGTGTTFTWASTASSSVQYLVVR